jgi:hypothetical protein
MEISMQGEKLSMLFDRSDVEILQQALEEHMLILERRIGEDPITPGSFADHQQRDLDRVEVWMETIDEFLGA